jgi:hypothetical protein
VKQVEILIVEVTREAGGDPDSGVDMSLLIVRYLSTDYMALYTRRQNSSWPLKFQCDETEGCVRCRGRNVRLLKERFFLLLPL